MKLGHPMRLSIFLAVIVVIVACTQQWYITIEPGTAPKPVFCLSTQTECRGEGVQLLTVDITEVDGEGKSLAVMWSIQSKSDRTEDYVLKRLNYGVVPPGWTETEAPKELRPSLFYGVNGKYFFVFDSAGRFRVLEREEFFKEHTKRHS